jgi:hypothetical protein
MRRSTLLLAAVVTTLLLSSCNVFEPFHTPGTSGDVEDLLSDANDALDKGQYQKALSIMDKAMSLKPDDPRVRYLHAVSTVKSHDIDMLDVLDILQPSDGEAPVGVDGERVLLMSNAELVDLFYAFRVVSVDLAPLVAEMAATGRELPTLRESDDVFLSYGVSETLVGMLRVLDNDDTETEFSVDERLVIQKRSDGYDISARDILLTPGEQDAIVDAAIERTWDRFVRGRHAFFCYYQFVINEVVWTESMTAPPDPLPRPVDTGTAVGEMVVFVDNGVTALYEEKEDLPGGTQ